MPEPSRTAASQADRVFDGLRTAILTLEILPGTGLSERGLEARFDASRTPSRAALDRLRAEGLVERSGRGWRVAPIDLADLRQVSDFRAELEATAIRWAIKTATDQELADLGRTDRIATHLADPAEQNSTDAGLRAVVRGEALHLQLATLSGNHYLVDALAGTLTRLARSRWLVVADETSRAEATAAHDDVLTALRARDTTAALAAMEAHLRQSDQIVIDRLRTDAALHRLTGTKRL